MNAPRFLIKEMGLYDWRWKLIDRFGVTVAEGDSHLTRVGAAEAANQVRTMVGAAPIENDTSRQRAEAGQRPLPVGAVAAAESDDEGDLDRGHVGW